MWVNLRLLVQSVINGTIHQHSWFFPPVTPSNWSPDDRSGLTTQKLIKTLHRKNKLLNTDEASSPNNPASPCLLKLKYHWSRCERSQTSKPVLTFNQARTDPLNPRRVPVDPCASAAVLPVTGFLCVSRGAWRTCPSKFQSNSKRPSPADGGSARQDGYSSVTKTTASPAQNEVDHSEQLQTPQSRQVQSKHSHLSVLGDKKKKKKKIVLHHHLDINSDQSSKFSHSLSY